MTPSEALKGFGIPDLHLTYAETQRGGEAVRCAELEELEDGDPNDNRHRPLCNFLPHDVRPEGYYLNARAGDPD